MALSKNTPVTVVEGIFQAYPLYQALHAYEGSMIFRKSDGYACLTAAGNPFLGHAWAEANNASGASAALDVYVPPWPLPGPGDPERQWPSPMWAKRSMPRDDATLTLTATTNSYVGRCALCHHQYLHGGISSRWARWSATVVQQAHIADAKVNYTTGDLDAESEIIAAFNTTNGKINALLAELETAQVLASS